MLYRFGAFEIDTARAELRGEGRPREVEPRVFDLLCYLVENHDRVVGCAELHETVWKGRVVTDAALSSAVKFARRAVDDDGRAQRLIRTVHRRGFRFVAEVDIVDDAPRALCLPRGAGDAIARADAGELDARGDGATLARGRPALAVLPFAPLGGNDDGRALADGLTCDIIARLGQTRWLGVIDRGTVFRLRDNSHDVAELAARHGVRYLLRGSLHRANGRVRVRAALSDAESARERWAERFDRPVDDLFALQDEITDAVSASVRHEIALAERAREKRPERLDAWEAYHHARRHLYRCAPEHLSRARVLLERAIALEPQARAPHAAMSFLYWQRAFLEIERADCALEDYLRAFSHVRDEDVDEADRAFRRLGALH